VANDAFKKGGGHVRNLQEKKSLRDWFSLGVGRPEKKLRTA